MFVIVKVTIDVYTQVLVTKEGFTSFPINITGGKVHILLVGCGTPTKIDFVLSGLISREWAQHQLDISQRSWFTAATASES